MAFGKYWMKNMKVSSKESEKYQQMGLGSFHMRNYPVPYRIVFVVNVPKLQYVLKKESE